MEVKKVALPIFNTTDRTLSLLQTQWSSILNPVLNKALVNGLLLTGVSLNNGTTVINHMLSRKLQGWYLVDATGAATVYRNAPKNDLTLSLFSNAAITADIFVF